jgi:hypothetical protein
VKRCDLCCNFLGNLADDDTTMNRLVFRDEATFRLLGRVNRHNLRNWGSENPHDSLEHERDRGKLNVFAAVSREKM